MQEENKYSNEFLKSISSIKVDGKNIDKEEIDIYNSIWISSSKYIYSEEAETDNCWNSLRLSINQEIPTVIEKRKNIFTLQIFKWAAIILVVIGLGWFSVGFFNKNNTNSIEIVHKTSNGVKETFDLEDGTKIILNSESFVKVEKSFNNTERKISFKGEAFFEVAHNAEKPFIITSNGAEIKVLGTSFNAVSYPEKNILRVALKTGKVRLTANLQFTEIVAGETVEYNFATNKFSKSKFDIEKDLGWINNKLVFENESLKNVIESLEKTYGVKITYDKNLELEKITVTFDNQSIEQVLLVLNKTLSSEISYQK